MTALLRLGLRLARGGMARERVRSASVAAAAAVGIWAILVTLSVVAAVVAKLKWAYGGQELGTLSNGVLLAVGVPVVVLVATAARLSASLRDRRLASLRLIGLSPGSTRLVAAVEVGVATLVGALVGVLAFVATRVLMPRVRLDGLVVNLASTGVVNMVTVLLAMLLVSAVVAQAPTRRQAGHALATVRAAETRRAPWWRVAPVLLGVVMLVVVRALMSHPGEITNTMAYTLFGGAALTGLGLLVLLPVVVRLVAAGLVKVASAPAGRLAGRRMQAQPAGVQRVVAGLLAALFVVAAARMVLVAFESTPQYQAARSAVDGGAQRLHVAAPHASRSAVEAVLRGDPLVDRLVRNESVHTSCRSMRSLCLSAFVGTCAELIEAKPNVTGCRDDTAAFLGDRSRGVSRVAATTLTWRGSHRTLTLPTPTHTLPHTSSSADLVDAAVFLPLATPGVDKLLGSGPRLWSIEAHGGPGAVDQIQSRLRRAAPAAWVQPEWSADDLTYVDTMRRGLWMLAALVIAVGLLSFVLGGVDRALSRRAESARLQVFGTPRRTIVAAQWIEGLLPMLLGVPLAVGLGTFAGQAYLSLGFASLPTPWTGVMTMVGATLLGSVVVTGLTVVAAAPPLRADLIRAE